jgi:GNAT superfamily N-acetyltransferase
VRLVESQPEFDAIPQQTSHRRPWPAMGRQYCIWDQERAYGFVQSLPFQSDAWVSDLFVHHDVRNRGYGRALMSRLLQDDQRLGVEHSVLLASKAGARVYPYLGYQLQGVLQIFSPRNR